MSNYDQIDFKSKFETVNNKLPVDNNETMKDFKVEFIETFENLKADEIKKMMYLDPKDEMTYDFTFAQQESIGKDYFNKAKVFDPNASNSSKVDFVIDFIDITYGVVTPKVLKKVFEEVLGVNLNLRKDDYERMIFYYFNKYQVNLREGKDKLAFKDFLLSSMQKEKDQVDSLPSVIKKNEEIKVIQKNSNNVNKNQNIAMNI